MLVRNLTNAIIVLPSRHKLQPGDNQLHESILSDKRNLHFITIQSAKGKVSMPSADFANSKPKPVGYSVERQHLVSGPLTRLDLCKLSETQVMAMALKMNVGVGNLTADEVRVLIAEEMFE